MHAAVIHDRLLMWWAPCSVCSTLHRSWHCHALMTASVDVDSYTETSLSVHNSLCHWGDWADSIAVYLATVHRCYVIINATVQWCASGVLCVMMVSYRDVMTLMLRWRWMNEADEWVVDQPNDEHEPRVHMMTEPVEKDKREGKARSVRVIHHSGLAMKKLMSLWLNTHFHLLVLPSSVCEIQNTYIHSSVFFIWERSPTGDSRWAKLIWNLRDQNEAIYPWTKLSQWDKDGDPKRIQIQEPQEQ
jgi:hypothetical protein